jgi:DNA primase
MKNITLALDENVLAAVRRYAANRGTTVNAIVRDHLGRIAEENDRLAAAKKRLKELSDASTAEVGPITWTRDDIYDRHR